MNLHILTAYTRSFEHIGNLCYDSILRYGRRLDISHSNSIIPETYDRAASWYKLAAIRERLANFDYVLWVDADALIIGNADVREIIQPATLNLARDANGINCGVVAWRNCRQSFDVLDRLERLYAKFSEHPWAEQGALMSFESEVDIYEQPHELWNAYPTEIEGGGPIDPQALICHWPGMPANERVPWMKLMLLKNELRNLL